MREEEEGKGRVMVAEGEGEGRLDSAVEAKGESNRFDNGVIVVAPSYLLLLMLFHGLQSTFTCCFLSPSSCIVVLSNILVGLSPIRAELRELECFWPLSRPMLIVRGSSSRGEEKENDGKNAATKDLAESRTDGRPRREEEGMMGRAEEGRKEDEVVVVAFMVVERGGEECKHICASLLDRDDVINVLVAAGKTNELFVVVVAE